MNQKNATAEDKILEAAKKVFLERGFDGARTQDIATAAGVNKALLHYYFQTKEKLFEAVLDYIIRDFVPKMLHIAQQEQPFNIKIGAIIDNYIDFYMENTHEFLFLINEMHKNPERLKAFITHTSSFPKMMDFLAYLQREMLIGTIKTMHPIHFMMNIVSLCAMPALASPMLKLVAQLDDTQFKLFIEQRRKIVKQLILESVLVKPL